MRVSALLSSLLLVAPGLASPLPGGPGEGRLPPKVVPSPVADEPPTVTPDLTEKPVFVHSFTEKGYMPRKCPSIRQECARFDSPSAGESLESTAYTSMPPEPAVCFWENTDEKDQNTGQPKIHYKLESGDYAAKGNGPGEVLPLNSTFNWNGLVESVRPVHKSYEGWQQSEENDNQDNLHRCRHGPNDSKMVGIKVWTPTQLVGKEMWPEIGQCFNLIDGTALESDVAYSVKLDVRGPQHLRATSCEGYSLPDCREGLWPRGPMRDSEKWLGEYSPLKMPYLQEKTDTIVSARCW